MSEYILYSHGNSANDKAIHNKVMELMKPDKTDIIIIPSGTESIQYFAKLKYHYQKLGFKKIDTIDFDYDANTDDHILADYNTFHLSAGNPIHAFSQLIKSGVIDTLYRQAISEKTFIGNSGGSMWLTCNLSLFRLVNNDLYKVANEYSNHKGMNLVDFEFLPHYNLQSKKFINKVIMYSKLIGNTIYCCSDGGGIIINNSGMQLYGEVHMINCGLIKRIN